MAIALAVIALISLALGAYEYAQVSTLQGQNSSLSSEVVQYDGSLSSLQKDNQNLSSTISSFSAVNPIGVVPDFLSHISHIALRNVTAAVSDYASNAVMIWTGDTQGYGGTYDNSHEINETLSYWADYDTNLTMSIPSLRAAYAPNGTAYVDANIDFGGHNTGAGNFNGTITASYSYVRQDGTWLVSREAWNFESFTIEFAGGAGGGTFV